MLLFQFILIFVRIPAWILYLGWSIWPQVFVYEPMDAPRDALVSPWSLERQLESGGISIEAHIAFADRLLDGMYESESSRWNERRNALLAACIDPFSSAFDHGSAKSMLGRLGNEHGALLDFLGADVLESIINPDRTPRSELKSGTGRRLANPFRYPYKSVRYLVDAGYRLEHPRTFGEDRHDRRPLICNRAGMMPMTRSLSSQLTIEYEHLRRGLGLDLAVDAGFANEIAMAYLSFEPKHANHAEMMHRSNGLTIALGFACGDQNAQATARLVEWTRSDDRSERGFALYTAAYWSRTPHTLTGPTDDMAETILNNALDSLHMTNVLWMSDDEPYSMRNAAQRAVVILDRSGEVSIPLIRDWILGGEEPPPAQYYSPWADLRLVSGWVEHLSDLAYSERVEARRWLAMAIPTKVGTPFDAQIDEVIAVLLNDEDEEVRDSAQGAFDDRLVTVEPDLWLFWD